MSHVGLRMKLVKPEKYNKASERKKTCSIHSFQLLRQHCAMLWGHWFFFFKALENQLFRWNSVSLTGEEEESRLYPQKMRQEYQEPWKWWIWSEAQEELGDCRGKCFIWKSIMRFDVMFCHFVWWVSEVYTEGVIKHRFFFFLLSLWGWEVVGEGSLVSLAEKSKGQF